MSSKMITGEGLSCVALLAKEDQSRCRLSITSYQGPVNYQSPRYWLPA